MKTIIVVLQDTADLSYVTGKLHGQVEALISVTQGKAELMDCYCRMVRARFIIEQAAMRHGYITRASKSLQDVLSPDKKEQPGNWSETIATCD